MILVSLGLCLAVVFILSTVPLAEVLLLTEADLLAAEGNRSLPRPSVDLRDEYDTLPDTVIFIAT